MFFKILSAILLPGILVVLFTRVTYNHITGLVLTVALIAASIYKGYTNYTFLIIIDAISLAIGFWYAKNMKRRTKRSA